MTGRVLGADLGVLAPQVCWEPPEGWRDIGIDTYIIAKAIDHFSVHTLTLQEKLQLRSEMGEYIGCDSGGVINPRQVDQKHHLVSDQVSRGAPPRLRRTYILHHSRLTPIVGNEIARRDDYAEVFRVFQQHEFGVHTTTFHRWKAEPDHILGHIVSHRGFLVTVSAALRHGWKAKSEQSGTCVQLRPNILPASPRRPRHGTGSCKVTTGV